MDIEIARQLLKKYEDGHISFVWDADVAERYYKKKNDILYAKKEDDSDPLHQSDNRVPSNFYKLLVNQKAAYAFTDPPKFDVGDESANRLIRKTLGDAWAKKCKALCIQAANAKVGWIHYWMDREKGFRYAVLDSRQVIPIWTKDLEKELKAVLRYYPDIDDENGDTYVIYEVWTDRECQAFRRRIDLEWEYLEYYPMFPVVDIDSGIAEMTDTLSHDYGEVPFIFFNNNDGMTNDLDDIKELIDSYDKVYSGFINDMEDIQQIIFILTNYGGESGNAKEVLQEMRNKVIMVESSGPDDKSGISTLAIEVPVEARREILTITRKSIFEQGMGIDPDPQNFGNSSGVALKYLYSLLELKTGMMETEFRISFNRLVRAIIRINGMREVETIVQTWKRSSVSNDLELAQICNSSKGIVSDETVIRNHPLVDDPEMELELMKAQKEENEPKWNPVPVKDGEEDGKE